MQSYYEPKTWNAICQVCGAKKKATVLQRRWDGLMVCQDDFETRHPSDLIRAPKEQSRIRFHRSEPTATYRYVIGIIYDEQRRPILDESGRELRG